MFCFDYRFFYKFLQKGSKNKKKRGVITYEKKMDGKPDGSGNGRIHGSVRQKFGGRHRKCRQQRARRDHGSGSGGQRGDTDR